MMGMIKQLSRFVSRIQSYRPTCLPLILLLTPFSLGGCALALEYPMTSASFGIWGATGKSPSDHALSYVTDQDCSTIRVLTSDEICKEIIAKPVEVVDKSTRYGE